MRKMILIALPLALVALAANPASADHGFRFSVNVGGGWDGFCPRPRPVYCPAPPAPVYVYPAPVFVYSAPVYCPPPRVWVPGYWQTTTRQVWVPGATRLEMVPEVVQIFLVGGVEVRRVVQPGYWRPVQDPGRWETRIEQTWVPGYWR